jgi:hypothetical protein
MHPERSVVTTATLPAKVNVNGEICADSNFGMGDT